MVYWLQGRVLLVWYLLFSLYTLHAKEIRSPSELVNGEKYVAVGHGKRLIFHLQIKVQF